MYKKINIDGNIPKMKLEYTTEGTVEKVYINHGTASWKSMYGGIEADGLHPLD